MVSGRGELRSVLALIAGGRLGVAWGGTPEKLCSGSGKKAAVVYLISNSRLSQICFNLL